MAKKNERRLQSTNVIREESSDRTQRILAGAESRLRRLGSKRSNPQTRAAYKNAVELVSTLFVKGSRARRRR